MRLLEVIVKTIGSIVVFGTIAFSVYVGYEMFKTTRDVGSSIWAPVEAIGDVMRATFGLGKHDTKTTADKRAPLEEIQCMTAIIAKDSEGERADLLGEAREAIADGVLCRKAMAPSLTVCDIMRKALTYYPQGWDHVKEAPRWRDRDTAVIRRGQSASAWTAAELVATRKINSKVSQGCFPFYIRADNNWTMPFSGESKARTVIGAMKPDLERQKRGFKTKFFQP